MRDRQAERREATRREILAAAWEVASLHGIGGVTLKEVAVRVGMKPPSLYSHFESKSAIYDAMFAQGWSDYGQRAAATAAALPEDPRPALLLIGESFFDYATQSPARYQLMSARVIPGFEPTTAAYAPAVDVIRRFEGVLSGLGVTDPVAVDLYTALISGLISQQMANDPGGSRWRRLLPRVIEMYADEMNLPRSPEPSSKEKQ